MLHDFVKVKGKTKPFKTLMLEFCMVCKYFFRKENLKKVTIPLL